MENKTKKKLIADFKDTIRADYNEELDDLAELEDLPYDPKIMAEVIGEAEANLKLVKATSTIPQLVAFMENECYDPTDPMFYLITAWFEGKIPEVLEEALQWARIGGG